MLKEGHKRGATMRGLFGWASGSTGGASKAADAEKGGGENDTNNTNGHDGEVAKDAMYESDGDSVEQVGLTGEESIDNIATEGMIDESDGDDDQEIVDIQEHDVKFDEDINDVYCCDEEGDGDDSYEIDGESVEEAEEDEFLAEENEDTAVTEGIAHEHDEGRDQHEMDTLHQRNNDGNDDSSPEEEDDDSEEQKAAASHDDVKPATERSEEDIRDGSLPRGGTNDTLFTEVKPTTKKIADHIHDRLTGGTTTPLAATEPTAPPAAAVEVTVDEEVIEPTQSNDETDDMFPKARDFLVDVADESVTLTEQAATIVEGFNDEDARTVTTTNDARTVATNRTSATRVQPVSAAFRSAMAAKQEGSPGGGGGEQRHPHQSIFDILDRNFEELGDGSGGGIGGRKVRYEDVKRCFVAFVAVFSLPSEPVFAKQDDIYSDFNSSFDSEDGSVDDHKRRSDGMNGGEKSSSKDHQKESDLQKVPLSVAFALWAKVLQQFVNEDVAASNDDHLSYVRSTLVLLGLLDLASIERDRDDGVVPATTSNVQLFGGGSGHTKKSIECLVVHDHIHQQYGEYLAWGDHGSAYRSLIEEDGRRWNEAVASESKSIGSNRYTLRMLPLNTMRAGMMRGAFDLLNEKAFVRRRMRVLGASGAAKAHVGDVDELLCLIEKRMTTNRGGDAAEPIDEKECLLGAYRQVSRYCLHEAEELIKPHKDEEGNVMLGETAMYRIADIGVALHLLGASLGGYGFFAEEMEYYQEALRLKTLASNGDLEGSVPASDTLHSMGFSLDNAGRSEEALEAYDRALDIRYECLGDDDLRVAETLHNKGALLCEEDRADEALECLEEALRIRELHHGEEHESCADTMQWMGNLMRKHGDASQALDYFKFALSIKQKRLGADDIDVANTLFNTAVLLDDIEKHDLSLVAYKEALRIRKLVLGTRNQEVADTLFCIGNVATVVENHEEALGYYMESIEIRESLIEEEDPSARKLDDSLLFIADPPSPGPDLLSQYEKLNQCFEEVLPVTKLLLGSDHPDVYDLLNRMGEVYMKLGDWDNAIGSFLGALRVKRADTPEGEDDVEVATLLEKKGVAHLYKTEFGRAKATFESAVRIQEKASGVGSIPVASSTYRLGVAYYYLNDPSRAKLLFRECLRVQAKHDVCVVRSLCWIGRQHEKLDEPQKALEKYLYALRLYKKGNSPVNYRIVAMLLHAIGQLYEDDRVNLQEMSLKCYNEEISLIHSKLDVMEEQTTRMLADAHFKPGMLNKRRGGTEKAIEHLEKALELTIQCDGEKNTRVASITDNLGMLYASREDFAVAKKHYSTAYSVYEKSIGRDDLRTSDCAFRLGEVLEALESNLALDFYKESLRVRRLNVSEDDARVGELLFCTGRVFLIQCSNEDAAKCFEEALGVRKRLLGDCADVANTYWYLGKTFSDMSQYEKALIFYRESVRINKKEGEKNSLYKVALDMAQCATTCSHFQLAIDCYNDCLQGAESLDNKGVDTALVLKKMGEIQMNKLHNYDDAKKLLLDALEIVRSIQGEDNGANQNIMTDLVLLIAQAYSSAKDYENSLDYYEEHIELLESNSPENEYLLANSLYAMGNIFAGMDDPDFELSIEKLTESLDMKKKMFGSDDERVANVVYTLATVYEKAGYYDKAANSLAEALHSFAKNHNKAGSIKVYHALGRMKASKVAESIFLPDERSTAIECYKEALKLRRQIMSLDDIEMAAILYEYSILLILNDEHATALPLLEEALRIQKLKNGLKDVHVANILLKMAEVHLKQAKYDSSLVCLEQVLFIQSSLDDDSDIDLGVTNYFLGTTHHARGDFHKAISSYSQCIEAKEWETKQLATVHNDLGIAHGKVRDFDKAIESFVHALRIRKTELGNNSLDYGHTVYNLAEIHRANDKHEQALNCLTEAIRVYELFPDEMSDKIAAALEMKGDALCSLEDYETSISVFQDCVELLDSLESDKNNEDTSDLEPSTACNEQVARVNRKMGHAFGKLGEYEEAFDSYREAIRIFSTLVGKNDLSVGEVMYDVGHLIVDQGGNEICEKSLEFFSEVIRIYGLHGKGRDLKVADSLFQKSALLADCSEYDEATSLLDEALDIYKESFDHDAIEIGKAMLLYGRLSDAQGKNDDAMAAFEEALRIFQKSLGEDDINVSLALSNIGIIHARKLEYAEAVAKCKRALKIRVMRGDQDQDVADSVFNIANILNDWGEEDEAYQYFQQCLKLYTHLLGEEDISVANCWQKLGAIYWNKGEVDHSLQSFLSALRICEQEDEDNVGNILASVYRGIGDCYYKKEDYDESLEYFAKCLRIQNLELGDDCIEMAEPCDFIGLIYQKKQKYDEAISFHSKALLINENHHDKGSMECASSDFQIAKVLLASHKYEDCITRFQNHLLTYYCEGYDDNKEIAEVYHLLGLAQSKIKEYEKSVTSLNKALSIRQKLCGKTNLKVAEMMLDLGKVLGELGDSDEAIAVYDQSITIFQSLAGSDFRAVASAYCCLGDLFGKKGNCEASLHSWKKALKILSSNSGSDSIVVGEILYHIGKIYDQVGNFDKSVGCFSESVKIFRSNVGENEMIGQALGYIGRNYARKKQYAKALELSTESLKLQKQFADAGGIAGSLVELGNILKAWGKTDQAIQFFEEASRTYEEAFGIDAVEVANCRQNVGILNNQLGKSEMALRYFGEALQVYRSKEGDKSLNVANSLFEIGRIYDSFGNREKSLKCFEEALKIREEKLGDDHLDVLAAHRFVKLISKRMQ